MEDNKRLVSMFVEKLWNERKLELADTIFDENCHTHQLRSGSPAVSIPRGPAAIKTHVAEWLSAFPDLRFVIEQIFAEGDRVFSLLAMEGTQSGQWLGIPPTGKRVNIRMVTIHRIQSGRIIEDWVLVESLGLFQQLGALPPTKDFLAEFSRRESV
jgi:predicted ester cyclase